MSGWRTALVVGMGSAGERHARLLAEMGLQVAAVSRRGAGSSPNVRIYPSLKAALDAGHPDYVVVANETTAHHDALAGLAEAGFAGDVLVEKPLLARPAALPAHRFRSLFVGYNLRFHPVVSELKLILAAEPAISAQIYCGQYLPDWRPNRDYRETSSASSAAGGGVLRDLSHELDYMLWLFGSCRRVAAVGGHFSPLAIQSDDLCVALMVHEACPAATLQLNYLDRRPCREIIVHTARRTLRGDLLRNTLWDGDAERHLPSGRDDTYRAQHGAVLTGEDSDVLCTAQEGLAVVDLVDAIETAAATGRWTSP